MHKRHSAKAKPSGAVAVSSAQLETAGATKEEYTLIVSYRTFLYKASFVFLLPTTAASTALQEFLNFKTEEGACRKKKKVKTVTSCFPHVTKLRGPNPSQSKAEEFYIYCTTPVFARIIKKPLQYLSNGCSQCVVFNTNSPYI